MTDGNSEDVARDGSEYEAAWRDLISRIQAPAGAGDAPPPWPEKEDLGEPPAPPGWRQGPATPEEDEHFVPPPPPPLPSLSPVAKGAWAALFGGPAYLLAATLAGWDVPGWAAFCAVAAFVTGFMLLVMRIGDDPPKDSGPGNGAVV